jgi:hypothetical protein
MMMMMTLTLCIVKDNPSLPDTLEGKEILVEADFSPRSSRNASAGKAQAQQRKEIAD